MNHAPIVPPPVNPVSPAAFRNIARSLSLTLFPSLLLCRLLLQPETQHHLNNSSLFNSCQPKSRLYVRLVSLAIYYYFLEFSNMSYGEQTSLSFLSKDISEFLVLESDPHSISLLSKKFLFLPDIELPSNEKANFA